MNTRITRVLGSLAAAVVSGGMLVASQAGAQGTPAASVAADHPGAAGWTPYHQEDVHYAAGRYCQFAVDGIVVRDHEEYRDVSHWPDGTVRTQLWRGELVMRWVNVETGKSVLRDQSASAVAEYGSDGELDSMMSFGGAFGVGLPAGSAQGQGRYIIDGRWTSLVLEDDGNRAIALGPSGTMENLCETLG